jgi:hypothetical protein
VREFWSGQPVVEREPPWALSVCRLGPSIARTRRLNDPYSSAVSGGPSRPPVPRALARIALMDGDAVAAILTAAEDFDVEAIVIGASTTRAPAILTARTRWQIQRRSPCAVITVSDHGRAPTAIRTVAATRALSRVDCGVGAGTHRT